MPSLCFWSAANTTLPMASTPHTLLAPTPWTTKYWNLSMTTRSMGSPSAARVVGATSTDNWESIWMTWWSKPRTPQGRTLYFWPVLKVCNLCKLAVGANANCADDKHSTTYLKNTTPATCPLVCWVMHGSTGTIGPRNFILSACFYTCLMSLDLPNIFT